MQNVYKEAHIRNISLLLVTIKTAVKEGNKLQIRCNVLIVVTKYSKFGSEITAALLFLSCYMGENSFLLEPVF